ncbi:hypothetical protein DEE71_21230, partial [Ralstonia insidiosa]|nr:hypothetical protein [Ralstonia pickettii]MBX3819126.1 hypothetical protein [Ralstonia insidiosa]MBX3837115.1 hypothetical protein [Ralstonia insidiosa]MBX3897833.1 hypothetical protein [Ralstonia insidiosa]
KRHLTAFGVGQFSMQILGQDSVQINTVEYGCSSGRSFVPACSRLFSLIVWAALPMRAVVNRPPLAEGGLPAPELACHG